MSAIRTDGPARAADVDHRVDSRIANAEFDWDRDERLEARGLLLADMGEPYARQGRELLRLSRHLYRQALGLLDQLDGDDR